MQRLEGALRAAHAETDRVAEQLRAAKGVHIQADAGRMQLQRELAAAETHWCASGAEISCLVRCGMPETTPCAIVPPLSCWRATEL